MPSPKGDPTYIKNKERFFMDVALSISKASLIPSFEKSIFSVEDKKLICWPLTMIDFLFSSISKEPENRP